jgi:nitrile hydratase accessory protein
VSAPTFELTGAISPPLANGELAFETPWQGRVFGIARVLAERGLFSWDDFRARLIEAIARWESAGDQSEYRYYDCFLTALEAVLVERGVIAAGELAARVGTFAARAPDHHHHHAHDD